MIAIDHIITNQPHLIPSSLLMMVRFRAVSKKTQDFVDRHLWEWVHTHFIPGIVGLPSDLVPEYYLKFIGMFFRSDVILDAYDRAFFINEIGDIFLGTGERSLASLCLTFPRELIETLKGREIILRQLDKWTAILKLQSRFHAVDLIILADAKHALRSGFVIRNDARLCIGFLGFGCNVYPPAMVEDFDPWRQGLN
jgi:hypothetical protein